MSRIEIEGWRVADAAAGGRRVASARPTSGWPRYRAGGGRRFTTAARRPGDARMRLTPRDRLQDRAAAAPAAERAGDRPSASACRAPPSARSCAGSASAGWRRSSPKPPVIRYQRERPGELIHIDTKKLGRIDGVGHRITGDRRGRPARHRLGASCTSPSTMPRASPTPRSCPTRARRAPCAFLDRGAGLLRPPWRQRRARDDRQRLGLPQPRLPPSSSPRPACATSAPGPTRRAPTARPSASSRPRCANGPTPRPTPRPPNGPGHAPLDRRTTTPHRPHSALSRPHTLAKAEQPSWKRQLGGRSRGETGADRV